MTVPLTGSNVPPSSPAIPATAGGATSTSTGADPARATDGRFEPTEWRYPANYAIEYLRGRTAEEGAQLSNALYQQLRQGQQPPQPRAVAPPTPQHLTQPTADDYALDPGGATNRAIDYARATQFDPWMQQTAATQAQLARNIVELREPDAFKRWGPEIDLTLQQLLPDPRGRTPEALQIVVDVVRSRHVQELADDIVRTKMAAMPQTMRADGAAGAASSANVVGRIDFTNAGLPDEYRRKLAQYNVTPESLDEFLRDTECRTRGIPLQQARDEWLTHAKSGDILTEARVSIGPDLNPPREGAR